VLAGRLRAAGFEVHLESSVAGARDADAAACCCAVLDLELPDGDGVALAEALRLANESLPVAFFTAGADPSIVAQAREQGPVFAKPDADAVVAWAVGRAGGR
jgi:FixJ family two-component response regulator